MVNCILISWRFLFLLDAKRNFLMDVITNISLICSLGPHNGFFDSFFVLKCPPQLREWNAKSSWDEQSYENSP